MEYIILFLLALILVLISALFFTIKKNVPLADFSSEINKATGSLRQELTGLYQTSSSDLSERLARTSGDLRQEISDRLKNDFQNIQVNLLKQLQENRQELNISMESIRTRVDQQLNTIGDQVQNKLNENIREGFKQYEKVQEYLKNAESQLQNLNLVGSSINELNNLLKLPHLRGGFGETTLEMLLADFLPASLYQLQAKISPESTERVDALILFPNNSLPIDSKFPREQILPLFETQDKEKLSSARETLKQVIKNQAKDINKKYIHPEHGTTDMALIFIPSETIYFEIIRNIELWEDMAKLKVFPTSPNTLAITLKGIAISMEYYQMAKGVEKTVSEIKKARQHFSNFNKKFEEVGKELEKAQNAFHTASTHLGRYSGSVHRLSGEEPPLIQGTEKQPE